MKLLTGGIRLSKARCNDIFWEAVWPRLLARGWHSEQPKNHGYIGSNHCLVFLIPGVKKFSKRKLVKGNHYFDSVSDVLNKVASEPKLIELETEEARGSSCNEEDRWVAEVPSGQDDPSIRKINRYLKPRVSSYNMNIVRFTVVDSGLADGGKLCKMREMRYAPDDLKVKSLFTTLSSSIEMIFLDNSLSNSKINSVHMPSEGEKNSNSVSCCEKKGDACASNRTKFTIVDTSLIHAGKASKVRELRYSPADIVASEVTTSSVKDEEDSLDGHMPDAISILSSGEKNVNKYNHSEDVINSSGLEQKTLNRDVKNKSVESLKDNNNVPNEHQSARTIKHKFSRRSRSGHSNNLVPVVKRRRLTACSNSELNHVMENFSVSLGSKREGSCCALSSQGGGSNIFHVSHPQKLSLTASSAEDTLEESTRDILGETCFDMETSNGENVKHETSSLIDLNLPQVPLEFESDEPAAVDVEGRQGANANDTCFSSNSDKPEPKALSASVDASPEVERANLNPRRQSTRNRPLTTRALEAIECGFFGVKRQKSMQLHTSEIPFSTSSHGVDSKVKVTSSRGNFGPGIVKAKERDPNEAFNKKDSVDQTRD
ncbi:hypothetical protein JCGZ_23331 [Jatropha curcas]|uniref:DUF7650 domain-containing protein n=2 Tax=Jatropha curcas TaxID=180498 RepID=A0A067JKZ3_JATCU|nr:hypothetical protein JCGZ_23331 [Jatropha curcas]